LSYYIRTVPGHSSQVWKIKGDVAVRLGVSNPENGPGCYYKADASETVWDCIRRCTPWFESEINPFHKTVLAPGQFYPRIARPIDQHTHESPGWSPGRQSDSKFIAEARTQLIVLGRQLDRICRTVHPEPATMTAYGHDIRNLLILACTEVENHWRGILEANGYIKKRYDTGDYVKLAPAMALGQYGVAFKSYPWLSPFSPFRRWGLSNATTQDLPWYGAYNAVKHNRETYFSEARLEHAFGAVSACVIMMAAQFGLPELVHKSSDLQELFQFVETPRWPLDQVYIYPYGEPAMDWTPVSYNFS
jgi:hypothetical protein